MGSTPARSIMMMIAGIWVLAQLVVLTVVFAVHGDDFPPDPPRQPVRAAFILVVASILFPQLALGVTVGCALNRWGTAPRRMLEKLRKAK